MSRTTVRLWVRRAERGEALTDRSSRPKRSPRQMRPYWRYLIISKATELRNRLERHRASASKRIRIQATWLKRKYCIPYSVKTILKVLHAEVFTTPPKVPAPPARTDCAARKRLCDPLRFWEVDIKYLTDIHGFSKPAKARKLPKYQITARDIRTGALFVGLAWEKSVTITELFIERLLAHLHAYVPGRIVIQTDNGAEFCTSIRCDHASAFTIMTELGYGDEHRLIPLGAKNWQSDVESSHRLIEDEFYQHHLPWSSPRLVADLTDYVHQFNHQRDNSSKGGTPLELLQAADPSIDPRVLVWEVPEVEVLMTRSALKRMEQLHLRAREIDFQERSRFMIRRPLILPRLPAADDSMLREIA